MYRGNLRRGSLGRFLGSRQSVARAIHKVQASPHYRLHSRQKCCTLVQGYGPDRGRYACDPRIKVRGKHRVRVRTLEVLFVDDVESCLD